MYAVIKTGGKQYKVATGDLVKVEKVAGEEGSTVIFSEVMAIDTTIGQPFVAGASVKAQVVKQAKDEKVIIFKKKRRQNYRRKNGHRQEITIVKIMDILAKGEKAEVAEKAEKVAKPAAEKTTATKTTKAKTAAAK